MNPGADFLYTLNPSLATPDPSSYMTYVTYEDAQAIWNGSGDYSDEEMREYSGWWTFPLPEWPDPDWRGDAQQLTGVTFPCGTSFVGSFPFANHEVKFVCAGQVQAAVPVNFKNMIYPLFCNPLPRDIQFKEVTSNINPGAEFFYKLWPNLATPNNATAVTYVSYENAQAIWNGSGDYSDEEMREYSGWWTFPLPEWPDPDWREDAEQVGENIWKAGEGWMGCFVFTSEVVITFPAAIPATSAE